jgi:hypothetical protein
VALIKGRTCLHSSPLGPKYFLILSVNGVLCYFSPLAISQGIARVFGRNVDKAKVEVRVGVQIFFLRHLKSLMLQFGLV